MKVSVDYFGVPGTGRNVTEAKQDAGRTISRIMANLSPKMYARRGHAVVVYQNTEGASYSLIHPDSEGAIIGSSSCNVEDAEQSAIRHLLSITRHIGEYGVPSWVPKAMHRELVAEWRHNDGFQLAYRHAQTLTVEEMGGIDCHHWAVTHTTEFMSAD